jgi:hypothetical protein
VICAATEYRGGTEAAALALIDEKIRANTEAVLDEVQRTGMLPRAAAVARQRACPPGNANATVGQLVGMNCARSMPPQRLAPKMKWAKLTRFLTL